VSSDISRISQVIGPNRKEAHALSPFKVQLNKPARYGDIGFIKKTGGANGEVDVLEKTFV
jgi:hypothetical protein